jgi:cytochrome c553
MNKLLIVAAVTIMLVSLACRASDTIEQGKAAVEKHGCAACHGSDFNSPIDPSYPKLAGQHKDYLVHALTTYQRGADAPYGRVHAIMGGQAKALSATEIQQIAAYLHSLPGSLVLRK